MSEAENNEFERLLHEALDRGEDVRGLGKDEAERMLAGEFAALDQALAELGREEIARQTGAGDSFVAEVIASLGDQVDASYTDLDFDAQTGLPAFLMDEQAPTVINATASEATAKVVDSSSASEVTNVASAPRERQPVHADEMAADNVVDLHRRRSQKNAMIFGAIAVAAAALFAIVDFDKSGPSMIVSEEAMDKTISAEKVATAAPQVEAVNADLAPEPKSALDSRRAADDSREEAFAANNEKSKRVEADGIGMQNMPAKGRKSKRRARTTTFQGVNEVGSGAMRSKRGGSASTADVSLGRVSKKAPMRAKKSNTVSELDDLDRDENQPDGESIASVAPAAKQSAPVVEGRAKEQKAEVATATQVIGFAKAAINRRCTIDSSFAVSAAASKGRLHSMKKPRSTQERCAAKALLSVNPLGFEGEINFQMNPAKKKRVMRRNRSKVKSPSERQDTLNEEVAY